MSAHKCRERLSYCDRHPRWHVVKMWGRWYVYSTPPLELYEFKTFDDAIHTAQGLAADETVSTS